MSRPNPRISEVLQPRDIPVIHEEKRERSLLLPIVVTLCFLLFLAYAVPPIFTSALEAETEHLMQEGAR